MTDPFFVHPELGQVLEDLDTQPEILSPDNIVEARARSKLLTQRWSTPGTNIPDKHSVVGNSGLLDLWYFKPPATEDSHPCIIWFHGGGYVMGHARDMWFGQLFSEFASCGVLSVEYRLAPEHRAPAAVEDGFAALAWVVANAERLGIDSERIAIGGASAGAGVAAGLALMNRDIGGPRLALQLLLYPMLDCRHMSSADLDRKHPIWWREQSLACWSMYLGGSPDPATLCYAVASEAKQLSGLPPTRMFVGTADLFHDEVVQYHSRLRSSGVDSQLRSYRGMFHGGEVPGSHTSVGLRMCQDYVDALAAVFGKDPKPLSEASFMRY